jgi:hypothetical protein
MRHEEKMMRRYTKAMLLMLVALLYAGTAGAVSITISEVGGGSGGAGEYAPLDMLTVDVVLDPEGVLITGYTMMVEFDATVLSPFSATNTPPAPWTPGFYSPYLYPNSYFPTANDGWYLGGATFTPTSAVVDIANLVFEVMDVPGSTYAGIAATLDDVVGGGAELFILGPLGAKLENMDVTRVPLSVHVVPEPTTTMLMGLGLLGILYAGRRR